MSRTSAPSSRSLAAVPPVETISTLWRARPAARRSSPLVSDSEISALRTGTRSAIKILRLTGAAQLPADFAAQCRNFADDCKLHRALHAPAPVDPDTFLGHKIAAATPKIPRRRALRAQDRAHAVGGDRRLHSRGEMEAHRIRRRFADLLASLGLQLIGAAEFLAVIAEHEAALVDHSECAHIAVVAGLQPAGVIVFGALDCDVLDSFTERPIG